MREPDNGAFVVFENEDGEKTFWYREDEKAEAFGYSDENRWFEHTIYFDGPVSWNAVLNSAPDSTPILLVRAS